MSDPLALRRSHPHTISPVRPRAVVTPATVARQQTAGTGTGVIDMADGFGTTVEEMQRAGRHVFAVNDAVQADLATLRGRLAPLAGAWRGEASTAFTALMARWDADARALNEALRTIGEAIQGTGASYQAQEEQRTGELSAIRAALG